jgi:hypothetical protein
MAKITLQGVDSINDFWCYVNGDRSKSYVASGDGVNQPEIELNYPDFLEINVRYFLQDFLLWKMGPDIYSQHTKIYIVRDHRVSEGEDPGVGEGGDQRVGAVYTYYFFGEPLHTSTA